MKTTALPRFLLVDLDADRLRWLRSVLDGYARLMTALDWRTAEVALAHQDLDVVVLFLPHANPYPWVESVHELRAHARLGVLVLVDGAPNGLIADVLDAGADAVLSWPVAPGVLVATARALARRCQREVGAAYGVGRVDFPAGLAIDFATERVFRDGAELVFPPREWQVLASLAGRPGRALTAVQIGQPIWPELDQVDVGAATRVYMTYVRRRLGESVQAPRWIFSVKHLRGYRFVEPLSLPA